METLGKEQKMIIIWLFISFIFWLKFLLS